MKGKRCHWYGYGLSDIGLRRPNNEDIFLIDDNLGVYLVADGMGGIDGGEVASGIIADHMVNFLSDTLSLSYEFTDVRYHRSLQNSISSLNDLVYRQGIKLGFPGMGATLVLVLIREATALVAHIGDSRCYHIHNGTMKRITEDHALKEKGFENILTQVIGMEESVEADINLLTLADKDKLLLCTDGLTNMLSDDTIKSICLGKSEDPIPQQLINQAIKLGGKDNVTALIIQQSK